MHILLDECVPAGIALWLRSLKHPTDHIAEIGLPGLSNGEVYELAKAQYDLLITTDRHFRHPIPYPATETLGIIYLRVVPLDEKSVREALAQFFQQYKLDKLVGSKFLVRRKDHERVD